MKKKRVFSAFLIALGLWLVAVIWASAAGPTDVIKEFLIDIKPQSDGSLQIDYTINWCVLTNELGDLTYIYVGVPNRNYAIVSYGGEFVTGAQPRNTGLESSVQLNLSKSFRAGDCFTAQFGINQQQIAHKKETEISYQFIPGWFDDIAVEKLRLTWQLPEDESLIHLIEPEPTLEGRLAVWETSLQPGEKFTVNLLYGEEVFPDFEEAAAPVPAGSSEAEGGLGWFWTILVIVLIIVVFIFLLVITGIDDSDYSSGSYIGGYSSSSRKSTPTYTGGLGSSSSARRSSSGSSSSRRPSSSSSRSTGGSGRFGGRGSSCACACVSCACACACAGGGRAGCSRKGFDIASLLKRRT
jgi:hypothetical protein